MAATNFTPISLYYSTTASAVPTAANLVQGELAINTADGKLYYEDSSGVVQVLATKSTGSIGGSNTQVQFNNSGSLGGSSSFTWDGTTVTATKFAGALNGTVGATTASTGAFTTLSTSSTTTFSGLTASTALALDASKNVVSVTNTGTGNNVLSASPTLTGTIAGASLSLSSLTSGRVTYAGASGLLTDSANLLYSGTDLTVYGITVGRGGGGAANTTAVGYQAFNAVDTGSYSSAVGYQAGYSQTSGARNNYLGWRAGYANTSGTDNSFVGHNAGVANTTGVNSTAIGSGSLQANTTASNNTAVGYQALTANTTGGATAIGWQSGSSQTTGSNNTYVGQQAGNVITTGSGCLYVGYQAQASSASVNSEVVIGASLTGKGGTTSYIQGQAYNSSNTATWSVTSDQRLKKNIFDNNDGLDIINQIQVRNFEYRLPEEITEVPQDQAIQKQGVQLGVIAQELQQILPECVKTESTGVMSVDADNLTWYMINAIKELTAKVAQLESKLGA